MKFFDLLLSNKSHVLDFFATWIQEIELTSLETVKMIPMYHIKYASIPANIYSELSLFFTRLEAETDLQTCLLYKDSLLWTGLTAFKDTALLVDYLNEIKIKFGMTDESNILSEFRKNDGYFQEPLRVSLSGVPYFMIVYIVSQKDKL